MPGRLLRLVHSSFGGKGSIHSPFPPVWLLGNCLGQGGKGREAIAADFGQTWKVQVRLPNLIPLGGCDHPQVVTVWVEIRKVLAQGVSNKL